MKTILTALTFASSLLSAPVFAQDATMTMEQGLSMLGKRWILPIGKTVLAAPVRPGSVAI